MTPDDLHRLVLDATDSEEEAGEARATARQRELLEKAQERMGDELHEE